MTWKFVHAEEKLVSVFAVVSGHLKYYLLHFHFLLLTWTRAPLHGCFLKISTEIFFIVIKKNLVNWQKLTKPLDIYHKSRYKSHINHHVEKVRSVWWAMLRSVLLEFTESLHVALGLPGQIIDLP